MNTTMEAIRARLTAAEENYPVHIGCGGECEPRGRVFYDCAACGRTVSAMHVALPDHGPRMYTHDVTELLHRISRGTT